MMSFRRLAALSCLVLALTLPSSRMLVMATQQKPTVAVLGGGLAGLSATIEAHAAGAHVYLLEKEGKLGGNSAKATSGINGVQSRAQQSDSIADSVDQFVNDTLKAGHFRGDASLVQRLGENSQKAIAFIEGFGVDLSVLSQLGGHSVPRTHREPNAENGRPRPIGYDIVSALRKRVEELANEGHVTISLNSNITDVHQEDEQWVISTPSSKFSTQAVVFTTGGYSSSKQILEQHVPQFADLPTTNGPWAQGEGLVLGKMINAAHRDLDQVQVHPTGFVDPSDPQGQVVFLAPEALRGSGGILLDNGGSRFVDELAPRDQVTGAIWRFSHFDPDLIPDVDKPLHEESPKPAESFLVLNDAIVDKFGRAAFNFYFKVKKFFVEVHGLQALADYISDINEARELPLLGDRELLHEHFEAYMNAATGKAEDAFGKSVFPESFSSSMHDGDYTFYVARVKPAIHYTMGGLRIDTEARLQDDQDQTIAGAFAAGEVTGGVHGANRLGGNSLLECVVYGRIAGKNAGNYAADRDTKASTGSAHTEL